MFLEMVIRCLKCNLESQGVRHTRAVLKASAESRAALRVTLALLLSSLFHGLPPPRLCASLRKDGASDPLCIFTALPWTSSPRC